MRDMTTGKRTGPLSPFFVAFTERLAREGHAEASRWCNLSVFRHFDGWMDRNHIRVEGLDEATVERYWRFRTSHRSVVPADRPALCRVLAVLREVDAIPPKRPVQVSSTEQLIGRFQDHLSR